MYYFAVLSLLTCQVLGGYIGDHSDYHGNQAKPVVRADGFLEDTHEVAALKQHHLEALSHASSHGAQHHDHGEVHNDHGNVHHDNGDVHAVYHGPQALPKVLPDGHIADTHEVHAAKAAHLAAVSVAQSHGHHDHHDDHHDTHEDHHDDHHDTHEDHHDNHYHDHHEAAYHGPLANPHVLPSGHLADTHDVAAAKEAHLQALAHAHHH